MVYSDNDDSEFYDENIVAEFQVVYNVSRGWTDTVWLFGHDIVDFDTLSKAEQIEYQEG